MILCGNSLFIKNKPESLKMYKKPKEKQSCYCMYTQLISFYKICKHWTRSLFPQLTTTNRLHVYWWNRWNRQIWIFPSIPNTVTMYINSGAIYVHSATCVLTVRGNKQLYLRGGDYLRGERIDSVENDKKRRFRNFKNLLKALQQFLSFPTGPGYQDPPQKMQS